MGTMTPQPGGNVAYSSLETTTKTFTNITDFQWVSASIINNSGSNLTIAINGFTVTVKNGEAYDDNFEAFTSAVVTASGEYRIIFRS